MLTPLPQPTNESTSGALDSAGIARAPTGALIAAVWRKVGKSDDPLSAPPGERGFFFFFFSRQRIMKPSRLVFARASFCKAAAWQTTHSGARVHNAPGGPPLFGLSRRDACGACGGGGARVNLQLVVFTGVSSSSSSAPIQVPRGGVTMLTSW